MNWQQWFDKGLAFFIAKNYPEAAEAFSQVIQMRDEMVQAYNNRALCYAQLDKSQLALKDFKKALALEPQHLETLFNRGVYYFQRRLFIESLRDFDFFLELSEDLEVWLFKGLSHAKTGDFQEAIFAFTQALAIEPEDPRVYLNRGAAYGRMGKLSEAKKDFERAKLLDPDYKKANYNLELISRDRLS